MILSLTQKLATAVAPSGTVTIPYPAGFNAGHLAFRNKADRVYVEGSDIPVTSLTFTATAGGMQITNGTAVSWNVGDTITAVFTVGGTNGVFRKPLTGGRKVGDYSGVLSLVHSVFYPLGAPAAASATLLANAVAKTSSGTSEITLATNSVDVARELVLVSSAAGDTTQTYEISGNTFHGRRVVKTGTLNGTTPVSTGKTFWYNIKVKITGAMAGNLSVGTTARFGLPVLWDGVAPSLIETETVNGSVVTTGTFTVGNPNDLLTTGADALGLYAPATAPNGTNTYALTIRSANVAGTQDEAVFGYAGFMAVDDNKGYITSI